MMQKKTMIDPPQSSGVHRMQTLFNIIHCMENHKWRKFTTEFIDFVSLKLKAT
jgi:hypothetical protein